MRFPIGSHFQQPPFSDGFWDIKLQRYWGQTKLFKQKLMNIILIKIFSGKNLFLCAISSYSVKVNAMPQLIYIIPMILGSRPWPFVVTWRHRSCDHWTCNVRFPIGSQYEPTMYLASLLRYWTSKILGSRPLPFGVTRHYQSRNHSTADMQFPTSGTLKLSLYLALLLRYYVSNT